MIRFDDIEAQGALGDPTSGFPLQSTDSGLFLRSIIFKNIKYIYPSSD